MKAAEHDARADYGADAKDRRRVVLLVVFVLKANISSISQYHLSDIGATE
jgi:hypothetical protein